MLNRLRFETGKLYKLVLHEDTNNDPHYFTSHAFTQLIFTRKVQVTQMRDGKLVTLAEFKGAIREIEVYPGLQRGMVVRTGRDRARHRPAMRHHAAPTARPMRTTAWSARSSSSEGRPRGYLHFARQACAVASALALVIGPLETRLLGVRAISAGRLPAPTRRRCSQPMRRQSLRRWQVRQELCAWLSPSRLIEIFSRASALRDARHRILDQDARIRRAMLLHQRKQRRGIGRMQPHAALRRAPPSCATAVVPWMA